MKKFLDVILLVQAYQLDIVNYRVFCGDFLFSCDSSSIRDNVRRSVGWLVRPSVRPLVGPSPTSFLVQNE